MLLPRAFRRRSLGNVNNLCRPQLNKMTLCVLRFKVVKGHDRRTITRRRQTHLVETYDVRITCLSVNARARSFVPRLTLRTSGSKRNGGRRHRSRDGARRNGGSDQAKGLLTQLQITVGTRHCGTEWIRKPLFFEHELRKEFRAGIFVLDFPYGPHGPHLVGCFVLFNSSQVNFRYFLRCGRNTIRIVFLRCMYSARFITAKAQHDVRSKNEHRRRHLSLMLRLQRAPNARLIQVVCQGLYRHVRNSRQSKQVCTQCAIRSIGRTFATFCVFVMYITRVVLVNVRQYFYNGLTGRQEARAHLTRLRSDVPSFLILHCRNASTSTTLQVTLKRKVGRRRVILGTLRVTNESVKEAHVGGFAMRLIQRRRRVMLLRGITGLIRFATYVRMAHEVIKVTGRGDAYTLIGRLLRLLCLKRQRALFSNHNGNTCLNSNESNGHRVVNVNQLKGGSFVPQVRTDRRERRRHLQTTKDSSSIIYDRVSVMLYVMARRLLSMATVSHAKAMFRGFPISIPCHFGHSFQDERIKLASIRIGCVCAPLLNDVYREDRFSSEEYKRLRSTGECY